MFNSKKKGMEMNVKNLVTKLSVSVAFILLACSLAIGQSETFQVVESEKIPDILRTISNQSKQNFEKIHTWQGEIYLSPNEVADVNSSRIIFKCDLDKELSYSKVRRKTLMHYCDLTGKVLETKSGISLSSHIATNEYRISVEPSTSWKGEVIERKAIKEKIDGDEPPCENCKGLQPAYLPRYIFDIESPVWVRYPRLVEIIEEKGEHIVDGLTLRVEQRTLSGDVQYRVHEPFSMNVFDINNVWVVKTFSANASYNMISSKMTSAEGQLMQQKSLEYQKVDGVYVPIRGTEDTFDYRDFSLRVHKEQVFKNVRINGVIPAETFTYKNLGLKDGDKFIDKIQDKEYTYQDGKLVEEAKKSK